MATELRCEDCGRMSQVVLEIDGQEMSGEEYAALAQMAGMRVLCDECGAAAGLSPAVGEEG